MPAFFTVHMGHGIPFPRFARFIWGTKFRARLIQDVKGARNLVIAISIARMGHEYPCLRISNIIWDTNHMGYGISCPRYTWCKWGTEFGARDLHGTYRARISVFAFTNSRWGTEFLARSKHYAYGARDSSPAFRTVQIWHGYPCPRIKNFI